MNHVLDSSRIRALVEAYRNMKDQEYNQDERKQLLRHGRQEFMEQSRKQLHRRGRQVFRAPKQVQEGCETTGYETTTREECNTKIDTKCENVTVTKFRPDIETKCTTRVRKGVSNDLTNNNVVQRLTRNADQPKLKFLSKSARLDMKKGDDANKDMGKG